MKRPRPSKRNIWSVKPESALDPGEGWVNVEMRWLIDENTVGSEFGVLGYTVFPPGRSEHKPHVHEHAEEYIMVVKGHGVSASGNNVYEVGPGDVVFIPRGEVHYTKNTSETDPLEIYVVYAGKPSLDKAGYTLQPPK